MAEENHNNSEEPAKSKSTSPDESPSAGPGRPAAGEKFLTAVMDAMRHWTSTPGRRKLTLQLFGFIAFLIALWFLIPSQKSVAAVTELGNKIGYPAFYVAQALLPLIGFPVIPFLVIGSFSFNFLPALIGTALATAVQLPLAYFIGRRFLKGMVHHLSEWFEFPTFRLQPQDQIKFIFFVKLVPGLSQTLRHYILAIYEVPFRQFMAIGWSMSMIFSTLVLLAGRTLTTGGNWNIYLGIAFIALVVLVIVILRKQSPSDDKMDRKESPSNGRDDMPPSAPPY